MTRTLKLTDNYYWDAKAISIRDPGSGNYYTLDKMWREYEWGTHHVGQLGTGTTRSSLQTVTFGHTFKQAPVVIITLATKPVNESGALIASTTTIYGRTTAIGNKINCFIGRTLATLNTVTTSGFTFYFHQASISGESHPNEDWYVNWLAISKVDWSSPLDPCIPLGMTDSNYWDTKTVVFTDGTCIPNVSSTNPAYFHDVNCAWNNGVALGAGKRPLIIPFCSSHITGTSTDGYQGALLKTKCSVKKTFNFSDVTDRKFKSAPTVFVQQNSSYRKYTAGLSNNIVKRSATEAPADTLIKATVYDVTKDQCTVLLSNNAYDSTMPSVHILAIGEEDVSYV